MSYPQFYSAPDGTKVVMVINENMLRKGEIKHNAATGDFELQYIGMHYTPEELMAIRRDMAALPDEKSFRKTVRHILICLYEEIKLARALASPQKH